MALHARPHGTMVAKQQLRRGDVCAAYNVLHVKDHHVKDHHANQAEHVQYRCTMSRGKLFLDVTRGNTSRKNCSTCRHRAVSFASEGGGEEQPKSAYKVLDSWEHFFFLSCRPSHNSKLLQHKNLKTPTKTIDMSSNSGKGGNQMSQADASRIQSSQVHHLQCHDQAQHH